MEYRTVANGNFVSYIRVSTDKQGDSGLGLEAQQAAVRNFLNGGEWNLLGEFVEVISGRKRDREALEQALAMCRETGATLVIAELSRLSRLVSHISMIMDSGVKFVCVDAPNAGRFELHIRAAVAEEQARFIGEKTAAALKAAKARGVKLGGFRGYIPTGKGTATSAARARAGKVDKANTRAADLAPIIADLRSTGVTSFGGIAKALNERGITTPQGKQWQAVQVQRVLARLACEARR